MNAKNTNKETIKALVVPFKMFEIKTTTRAYTNKGKNASTYAKRCNNIGRDRAYNI